MNAPIVYITESALDETARLLASFADEEESEGIVYWFGLELADQAVVTTLIVPDADTSDGSVRTSSAANAEAVGMAIGTPLVLLGQAHSHPKDRVGHSRVDDRETFAQFPGALSLVVPWFARRGIALDLCGVHRHLGGAFKRIPASEVQQHLRVLRSVADLRRAPKLDRRWWSSWRTKSRLRRHG
jgi:hypothetical protein